MSNVNTTNAPWPPVLPGNSTLTVVEDGFLCIKSRSEENDVFETCFRPTPGLELTFGEGARATDARPPSDVGSTDPNDPVNQTSTQQLMNSLIQMLQQLIGQIQGNIAVGGKA